MKIIDFKTKGNVIRFFLGADDLQNYYGDDWDNIPYEDNAGQVHSEFVSGIADVIVPFDDLALEPCCGEESSSYSKSEMVKGMLPCIIIVPEVVHKNNTCKNFFHYAGSKLVQSFYFNDRLNPGTYIYDINCNGLRSFDT